MREIFQSRKNKILFLFLLLFIVGLLNSCRQGEWPTTVYTTWGDEFKLKGFFQIVFGWPVAILSYPVAWLCSTIGKAFGNSFAWGIFFTTIIVRTVSWPIYAKTNSVQLKMTLMQPELEEVKQKYQGRTDPQSRQRQQMETTQIYKKYNVNPFGCLFTMLLQFPIFATMYEVVRRINLSTYKTIEGGVNVVVTHGRFALNNTKLFGIFELNTSFYEAVTMPDKIFTFSIAILFGAVNYLQQKLATRKTSYQKDYHKVQTQQAENAQKQAKMMTNVMTIMFVMFALSSTALAFYWLIGAVYQIGQSYIGRRMNEKKYLDMKKL